MEFNTATGSFIFFIKKLKKNRRKWNFRFWNSTFIFLTSEVNNQACSEVQNFNRILIDSED